MGGGELNDEFNINYAKRTLTYCGKFRYIFLVFFISVLYCKLDAL